VSQALETQDVHHNLLVTFQDAELFVIKCLSGFNEFTKQNHRQDKYFRLDPHGGLGDLDLVDYFHGVTVVSKV
jgi:hypothetical protein